MKNNYFEALDSLRFIVFLLILSNHLNIWEYNHGHTHFFTLSGFLIGYTSFRSLESSRKFSLKVFLLKRMLRTFPVYFLVLLVCGLAYLIFRRFGESISLTAYWSYFLFVQNYFAGDALFILTNLWAMAVVEQLYLGWGILFLLLGGRMLKLILPIAFMFIALACSYRFVYSAYYENTLTYAGIFLLGGYCGSLYYSRNKLFIFFNRLSRKQSVLLLFVHVISLVVGYYLLLDLDYVIKEHIISFLFCSLLMLICFSSFHFSDLANYKAIRYLGKLSYGLYCYHAIVITLVTKYIEFKLLTLSPYIIFSVVLVLAILVSIISYELIEKKFLRFKASLN